LSRQPQRSRCPDTSPGRYDQAAEPGAEAPAPAGSPAPAESDVWQAATLLIGLYGAGALEFAAARIDELPETAARDRATWDRISVKLGELLCTSSPARRH
jgi:hypothetical protein